MRFIVLIFSIFSFALSEEPSAFGAGDIGSKDPYGLTQSEEHILKNRQKLESLKKNEYRTKSSISELAQSVLGIGSVVEGMNEQSKKLKQNIVKIRELQKQQQDSITKNSEAIKLIQDEYTLFASQQNNNIEKFKKVLRELSKLIDSINSSYVSRDEFNAVNAEIATLKDAIFSELKTIQSSVNGTDVFEGKDNFQIRKDAKLFYGKKEYQKAISYFEYLITKHFKPAESLYYIGESYYYMGKYKTSIGYFKKSAQRYDKASYMATLLLHSGISYKKTGELKSANGFFTSVVERYPESKASKVAKEHLESN